jgi:hypothetical protein
MARISPVANRQEAPVVIGVSRDVEVEPLRRVLTALMGR